MGPDGRWSDLSGWLTLYPEEMSREFKDFEKTRVDVGR